MVDRAHVWSDGWKQPVTVSRKDVSLNIIGLGCPASCLTLWAWARLQNPPLSWHEAKAMADSGRITTEEHKSRRKQRLAYYVRYDQQLADSIGLLPAIRASGWIIDRGRDTTP